jgi:hypothetical protein
MLRATLTNTKKKDLTDVVYTAKMMGLALELVVAGQVVSHIELKEYLCGDPAYHRML